MMASLIGHLSIAQRYTNRFPAGSLELLYGCEDGRVVQLMIEPGAVRQGFTIPPPAGGGAVRALHCGADYSKVRERAAHLRRCTHCCQRGLSWEHHANAVWWCRLCDGVQGRLAGVICSPPPITPQSGCADIVIGREDGWLEVWDVDESGTPQKVRTVCSLLSLQLPSQHQEVAAFSWQIV